MEKITPLGGKVESSGLLSVIQEDLRSSEGTEIRAHQIYIPKVQVAGGIRGVHSDTLYLSFLRLQPMPRQIFCCKSPLCNG
jgi:hypothetical protein